MKLLKFIFLPIIILIIAQTVQVFVMAGVFNKSPTSILGHMSSFFVYMIFGASIYSLAPYYKLALSYIYALLHSAGMIFLGLYNDGVPNVFDKTQIIEFNLITEIVMVAGTFFGIHCIIEANKSESEAAS